MNRTKAEMYFNTLIEMGWSMEPFGNTDWLYGESPKKEYMAHVILEEDKELDLQSNKFYGRVRIWNSKFGNQIEIPELESFTLAQLDINSLKCHKCGEMVTGFKQLKLVDFDTAVCKECAKSNK